MNEPRENSLSPHTLVACFANPGLAETAVRTLEDDGVERSTIGVLLIDSAEARTLLEEESGSAAEGAKIGSVIGGTLWGLGAVALASSPIGLLAAGPVAALLGGGVVGAGVGGALGALVGLGIPEHEATLRLEELQDGGVLVTLPSPSDAERRERLEARLRSKRATTVFEIPEGSSTPNS